MKWDYNNSHASIEEALKINSENFITKIAGKKFETPTITLEGLVNIGHTKGIKSMITKIIQFPHESNEYTAVAETTIVGYDISPITNKLEEVTYCDYADATAKNVNVRIAPSYIRMASTRSQARALRKYLNINLLTAAELYDIQDGNYDDEPQEEFMNKNQNATIKKLMIEKNITPDIAKSLLKKVSGKDNIKEALSTEAELLINELINYKN